ncbi:lamin tail domain-containing protein [Pyxidicoccus trucidator]|uniref:lamin tail domain-containing protein n=1 Tax=Pyxidicoccus trucidator TaxID=2709662 RepID=UPI001F07C0C4|nr:lamin tail domain-containing protein [Pyxidicoccus trucidator]
MLSARMAGTLAVLVLLSACSGGRGEPTDGPLLSAVELSPTSVGVPYEARLPATGGAAPLSYSLRGTPPPGFSFDTSEARLMGPASESGEFNITVSVRDSVGSEDTRTYALKVWPAPALSDGNAPVATAGASYEHSFVAVGGQPPLRWSVAGGTLPTGLSLSSEGVLSGVPQGEGAYSFTLRVQDASGAAAQAHQGLAVLAPGGNPDGGPKPATFPVAVANWNIEWFGDPVQDPADDALQLTNAQAVIADAGADIWGLAEIVSTAQFNELKARLPGYDGFLADDSSQVSSGSSYYSSGEQKLGVLFKSDVVRVLRAEVVLTDYNFDFAGRPPLRVDLRVTRNGSSVDMSVMVVHLKATTSSPASDDHARRLAAAGRLKSYLDDQLPTQRVMVVGDWNDDVDTSTVSGLDTPFRNFVNDTSRYTFTTQALSLANEGSTARRSTFIDHQLATNEMMANYVPSSTRVIRPTFTGYSSNTSDHYPIFSRFDFGQGKALRLTAPNGGETLTSGTTYDITWTSNGIDTVRLRYSLDNGQTWNDLVASTPAASGSYRWTVPTAQSGGARVQVSDTGDASFSDASDSTFLLNRTAPRVFINEYLPQPNFKPGTSTLDFDQTFVELLNTGTTAVDISGWKLHDDKSYVGATPATDPARHIFPAGTVLQPGRVYTVYSGATAVPTGATNATFANGVNSTNGQYTGLRFDRGRNVGGIGDSVYLVLPDGTVEDSTSYADTIQGTSYNRSPDASSTDSWVLHTTLSTSLTASPGRRANGSAF